MAGGYGLPAAGRTIYLATHGLVGFTGSRLVHESTGPSRMGWHRRKCAIKCNPSPRVSERRTLGCACLGIRLHLSVGSRSHHGNGPRKRCWPRPTSCLCIASAGCRQCVRQLLRTRRAGRFRYRILSRWRRGSYTWGALEFDGIRLHILLHPAMRIVRRTTADVQWRVTLFVKAAHGPRGQKTPHVQTPCKVGVCPAKLLSRISACTYRLKSATSVKQR